MTIDINFPTILYPDIYTGKVAAIKLRFYHRGPFISKPQSNLDSEMDISPNRQALGFPSS